MREVNQPRVEVEILGRILEGRGQISSRLEDAQLEEIGEALKQSARRIEEPDSSSCGDGREVVRLASGQPGRLRPRKFGGSLSPFNMRALADSDFLGELSHVSSVDELYEACDQTSIAIGNRPAGHVGCGAGEGAMEHNRSVAEMSLDGANSKAVTAVAHALLSPAIGDEVIVGHMRAIQPQAASFAEIMQVNGWSGAGYVDRLAKRDGDSVEILRTDDTPLHGHAEDFIVLAISDVDYDGRPLFALDKKTVKKRTGRDYFGVNLSELARDANNLGQEDESKTRHLIAGLMHHIGGVAYNLIDGSQPVILARLSKN